MLAFLNPWFLLAGLLALLAAFGAGYRANDEAEKVQAAWDRANAVAIAARQVRIDAARDAADRLQVQANEDRRKRDEINKRRDVALAAALSELRNRPERPASSDRPVVPQPAGPRPEGGGCTGAGLYRDDAAFLTRRAELAQRIREQRDACYIQYDRAQKEIARINSVKGQKVPAIP